jgi:ABC-type microcin C transport system permease subunit YejE
MGTPTCHLTSSSHFSTQQHYSIPHKILIVTLFMQMLQIFTWLLQIFFFFIWIRFGTDIQQEMLCNHVFDENQPTLCLLSETMGMNGPGLMEIFFFSSFFC